MSNGTELRALVVTTKVVGPGGSSTGTWISKVRSMALSSPRLETKGAGRPPTITTGGLPSARLTPATVARTPGESLVSPVTELTTLITAGVWPTKVDGSANARMESSRNSGGRHQRII